MRPTIGQQVISMDGARRVIDACVGEAGALGVAVVVTVVDPGGHQVAMARMDGSPLLSRGVAAGVAAHCTADAVHYFPPDMYDGPFVGGATIGRKWAEAVAPIGSVWTVDTVLCAPSTATAGAEWTHFKTFQQTVLRGDEWYRFDPDSGLLTEIRAYYASPQDRTRARLELGGFDYAGRGYATEPRFERSGR